MFNRRNKLQKLLDKSLNKAVHSIKEDMTKEAILKEINEREQTKKRLWASMSPGLKRKILRRQNAK